MKPQGSGGNCSTDYSKPPTSSTVKKNPMEMCVQLQKVAGDFDKKNPRSKLSVLSLRERRQPNPHNGSEDVWFGNFFIIPKSNSNAGHGNWATSGYSNSYAVFYQHPLLQPSAKDILPRSFRGLNPLLFFFHEYSNYHRKLLHKKPQTIRN